MVACHAWSLSLGRTASNPALGQWSLVGITLITWSGKVAWDLYGLLTI